MSDWWSKKLGGDAPAPRQHQPSTPPTQTPRWQPQPADPPQPNWAGAGGAGAAPVQPQEVHMGDALSGAVPIVTRGYKAAEEVAQGKVESNCPECGSQNYFSRSAGIVRGPQPAPHCHDCGYPIVQAGSGAGSLAGAKSSGPARTAPQVAYGDPAAHGT